MPRKPFSVRAILLDGKGELVLIKRTRPDVPVYWVAPGGGVEDDDPDLQSALHRELSEELGAIIKVKQPIIKLEDERGVKTLYYTCTLLEMHPERRCGPEFEDPDNGLYEIETVAYTPKALATLNIKPDALKRFLVRNAEPVRRQEPIVLREMSPSPTV